MQLHRIYFAYRVSLSRIDLLVLPNRVMNVLTTVMTVKGDFGNANVYNRRAK